jgi:hypothetical protein
MEAPDPSGNNLFVLIRNDGDKEFRGQIDADMSQSLVEGGSPAIVIINGGNGETIKTSPIGVYGNDFVEKDYPNRFAAVRLRPGESMFFGFDVPKNPKLIRVSARAMFLIADHQRTMACLLESGVVSLAD